MIKKIIISAVSIMFIVIVISLAMSCSKQDSYKEMTETQMAIHGKYLVYVAGCNDAIRQKIMTSMGPVPDSTNYYRGILRRIKLPEFDWKLISDKHLIIFSGDLDSLLPGPGAFLMLANLTSDAETGLGAWTKDMFFNAIRNGKHLGIGRPILPPMPWMEFKGFTDQDLGSIYAYLKNFTTDKK